MCRGPIPPKKCTAHFYDFSNPPMKVNATESNQMVLEITYTVDGVQVSKVVTIPIDQLVEGTLRLYGYIDKRTRNIRKKNKKLKAEIKELKADKKELQQKLDDEW